VTRQPKRKQLNTQFIRLQDPCPAVSLTGPAGLSGQGLAGGARPGADYQSVLQGDEGINVVLELDV